MMAADPSGSELLRQTCSYENLSERFLTKERTFSQQYSQIYSVRLMEMKSMMETAVRRKWGESETIAVICLRVVCQSKTSVNNFLRSVIMYYFRWESQQWILFGRCGVFDDRDFLNCDIFTSLLKFWDVGICNQTSDLYLEFDIGDWSWDIILSYNVIDFMNAIAFLVLWFAIN